MTKNIISHQTSNHLTELYMHINTTKDVEWHIVLTVSIICEDGKPPKISDDILRPIPPSHPCGVFSVRHTIEWRPPVIWGWTSTMVDVVVASIQPTGAMSVRESHSWPWRSALSSTDVPSCAILGQYRTVPSGETAMHDGTYQNTTIITIHGILDPDKWHICAKHSQFRFLFHYRS